MSKKTLNKINLTDLGAETLADLLLEVSAGSADIKRRLRFELSHHLGPDELGREVRKRLVSIRKSKAYAGWRKRKGLVKDLQTQADMICDKIAPDDPGLAFDLLWEFIELAPSVYERVDDSRGEVGAVFGSARDRFADITPLAMLEPEVLALRVWDALCDNPYGAFDGIIGLTASALGDIGLNNLKAFINGHQDAPVADAEDDHEALIFLRSLRGEDSQPDARKSRMAKGWLQEIAVVQGDVDAYAAQYTEQDLLRPDVAAEVAGLWMDEGRGLDALDLLENAELEGSREGQAAWDDAYIRCLHELGRVEDAQAHRWSRFEQTLSSAHLRGYLKPLADFDDIEVEDRAKAYALTFPHVHTALGFFIDWPDVALAAELVETRTRELDGDRHWLLEPAADALRQRHPLAAILVMRAMIDATLEGSHVSRYARAAENLTDCGVLDAEVVECGTVQSHADYMDQLRRRHDRKISFWSKVSAP